MNSRIITKMALFALSFSLIANLKAQQKKLYFGVAYYDEYMPYDRLDEDVKMMKATGINVVRIGESTWGKMEPQEGVFDFSHIDRVLNAMNKEGISVIVGTPTYAIPTWLAKKYPDILAITSHGKNQYGARQNMDITNVDYLSHAEIVIRKMLEHVHNHPAIIGYQVDNETKAYGTSGPNVQKQFVTYIKNKFKTLDSVNNAFGLNYWSNRINSWEDFPSTIGSINASLNAEFAKFQRQLVTNFLSWQAQIVREYKKPNQFITQNFDLDWKGYSYGIQPEVDHFAAAKALDVAGIDIYHPSQNQLTGKEISLGGDLARSMKGGKNYFVIETEAQGFPEWLPFPEQLRLQAFSHIASGANMLEYWHWSSIHNSAETYWKGMLSHDFLPNPVYEEAKTIGADFNRLSDHLINLKKKNEVAILFSNEALTGFNSFPIGISYNDVLRRYYDALYNNNVGIDFIDPSSSTLDNYKLIIVPALYAASDSLLNKLNSFVKSGGLILYSFKSGFSDQYVKVRSRVQPGIIEQATSVKYSEFTVPNKTPLKSSIFEVSDNDNYTEKWMELLEPINAKVLAYYNDPNWGKYAAITQNKYGNGSAIYLGTFTSPALTEKIVKYALQEAKLWENDQEIHFPIIIKNGINQYGKIIHYYFNYSATTTQVIYTHKSATSLIDNATINTNEKLNLGPWGICIVEEN